MKKLEDGLFHPSSTCPSPYPSPPGPGDRENAHARQLSTTNFDFTCCLTYVRVMSTVPSCCTWPCVASHCWPRAKQSSNAAGDICCAKYVSRRTGTTRHSGSPLAIVTRFAFGSSSITTCHG